MYQRIASIISYVFHPLLMPTLGLFIIFHSNTMESMLPMEFQRFVYILIFCGTFILPLSLLPILIFRRVVETPMMENKNERTIPFLLTLLFYILTIIYLFKLPKHYIGVTIAFQIACCACILTAFIINLRWKISLHLIGIGGIVGLIFFLYLIKSQAPISYLMMATGITGILAWARITTESHSGKEILAGLLTGLLGVTFFMLGFKLIPIL